MNSVSGTYLAIRRVVGLAYHGPFDTSTEDGRSNERLRRIILTAATAVIAKVLAMVVPLATITLTFNYLGKDVYGLWMTILGFFQLFVFADFGLGSGLLTLLSQSYGRKDIAESQKLTSSAFFLLMTIACGIFVVFCAAFPFIPWAALLGAETEKTTQLSGILVAAVFLPQVMQLPFFMIQRTQLAIQEGHLTNLWQCAGYVASILCVVLLTSLHAGALPLVFVAASIPVVVCFFNWCWFFLLSRRQLRPRLAAWDTVETKRLASIGGTYCLLAVLTTAGLAADNLIVAHMCGLEEVATFSVVSRVATLLTASVGMICMPMWAANGEALARGDAAWVQRTTKRVCLFTAGCALAGGCVMVLLGPWVFKFWLGQSFEVSRKLLLGLAGRELLLSIAIPFFMVLNGANKVWVQIRMFSLYTIVATVMKLVMAHWCGSAGVPWAMVLAYGTLIVPRVYLLARQLYTPILIPVVCK